MITFEKPSASAKPCVEIVRLEGKAVGAIFIEKDRSGYYYKPLTGKRGETFEQLIDVRRSLIGDDA